MGKAWYFAKLLAGSALAVVGIRADEESAYTVLRRVAPAVEIRAYDKRVAVETSTGGNDDEAFDRLFQYIAGANDARAKIAMTAPVQESAKAPMTIAMTVPVEISGEAGAMRFFLPRSVAAQGAPMPTNPRVRIVEVPATTVGVLRYSGFPSAAARMAQAQALQSALGKAGEKTSGATMDLLYDPPFALPFMRRNEVAVLVSGG